MDKLNFKIPDIARGTIIPQNIERMILEEELRRAEKEAEERKELEKERRQFRHDWKIAVFSTLAGALLSRPIWEGIERIVSLLSLVLKQ